MDSVGLGGTSFQTPPGPSSLIPWQISPRLSHWTKVESLLWGIAQMVESSDGWPQSYPSEKTYSDYLLAAWEAEKEEMMEPSCSHTVGSPAKPKVMGFFPLRKLKWAQPTKTPTVQLAHLEEEAPDDEEGTDSEDPDSLDGVREEFMVHLARAMKDAWQGEKCCYHCSSSDHFIRDCPLVKSARKEPYLNHKMGMVPKKGTQTPLGGKMTLSKVPQDGIPKA